MKKRIKLIIGFVIAALVMQLAAVLFLTPFGLELIYPIVSRTGSEKFAPDSNVYAVYYDIRAEVASADYIVVGVDFDIEQSYDILGHFTRFVKQYNNISDVVLNLSTSQGRVVSDVLEEEDERTYNELLEKLGDTEGMTDSYIGYISDLFFVNRAMPPLRQFEISSYAAGRASLASEKLAGRLSYVVSNIDRSALCVVDSDELSPHSDFKEEFALLHPDKKIIFINTYYSDTKNRYSDTENSDKTLENISFPFAEDGAVYFVNNKKFESFYDYYSVIADKSVKDSRERLDTRFTDVYFVVSGGTVAE
ncbi:MAG: hypothetical protein E7672_03055 [Ruminococcaceae bacterium]|nr:hypothetical protein [Oscillospiraceae bacterium]